MDWVASARARAEAGDVEAAIAHVAAAAERLGTAAAWFEYAGFLDWLGREADAVEPYERANALGLPAELRAQWTLQYGSTLRNVGRVDDAIAALERGRNEDAPYPAIDLMLALSLLSAGRDREAAQVAMRAALLPDPEGSLARYRRALEWYVEHAEI